MKFLTYTVNTTQSIEIKSAPEDFDRVTIDFEFLFGIDIVECCKEIRACLVVMASDGVSEEEKKKERDKVSALINNKLNKLIPQYIAFDQYKNEPPTEKKKKKRVPHTATREPEPQRKSNIAPKFHLIPNRSSKQDPKKKYPADDDSDDDAIDRVQKKQ